MNTHHGVPGSDASADKPLFASPIINGFASEIVTIGSMYCAAAMRERDTGRYLLLVHESSEADDIAYLAADLAARGESVYVAVPPIPVKPTRSTAMGRLAAASLSSPP